MIWSPFCTMEWAWIPNPWIGVPKGPKCFFCVNCTSKPSHYSKSLSKFCKKERDWSPLQRVHYWFLWLFVFFPLSIPRRTNKEISFLLFSINTRSTTSNRNPSPQLQHFGLLFSETVVCFGVWILKFSSEVQASGTAFHLLRRPEFLWEG